MKTPGATNSTEAGFATRQDGLQSRPPMSAVDRVKQMYAEARAPERFAVDLLDHLKTGYVCSWPGAFLMAKVIELPDGRRAWKITGAAGPLAQLASMLPVGPIPFVAFGRRNRGPLRIYSVDQFRRRIQKAPTPS